MLPTLVLERIPAAYRAGQMQVSKEYESLFPPSMYTMQLQGLQRLTQIRQILASLYSTSSQSSEPSGRGTSMREKGRHMFGIILKVVSTKGKNSIRHLRL